MDGTEEVYIIELPRVCVRRIADLLMNDFPLYPLDKILHRCIELIKDQTDCIKSVEQLTKEDLGGEEIHLIDIWTPRDWDR